METVETRVDDVRSVNPRTGGIREIVGNATSRRELDVLCAKAAAAAGVLRSLPRSWRAELLRGLADALEANRSALVAVAEEETALGESRLDAELTRTSFQLRLFADVVAEGGYLEATIDHAGETPMGPRPDLRRMLVPLGPVAVFGASNFPFAFSVPGGDTASALAAGCPVVVKAHESHPATSRMCADTMITAAARLDAPDGTIALVLGRDAGAELVQHPEITAVGFTGSLSGGQALMRLIQSRPSPIPFYGELASINPVVVTPAAAASQADQIGAGLAGSVTLGAGQFCTKPGLAFVPAGVDGDRTVKAAAAAFTADSPRVLLNDGITHAFRERVTRNSELRQLRQLAGVAQSEAGTVAVMPHLFEVDLPDLTPELTEECFGPVTLVVRYNDKSALTEALQALPSSLTATLHTGEEDDAEELGTLLALLEHKAGRVVFNGFPTGVAVSWAMHHGGGWPATNSLHTSVGPTAIRRFLRPMAWQNAPEQLLPAELREDVTGLPRRVDGVLLGA